MVRIEIFSLLAVCDTGVDGDTIFWQVDKQKANINFKDKFNRDVKDIVFGAIPVYYRDQGAFVEAECWAEKRNVRIAYTLVIPKGLENDEQLTEISEGCKLHSVGAFKHMDKIWALRDVVPLEEIKIRGGDTEYFSEREIITYPMTCQLIQAIRKNTKGNSGIWFTAIVDNEEYEVVYSESSQPFDDEESTFDLLGTVDGLIQSRAEVSILTECESKLVKMSYAEDLEQDLLSAMYHGKNIKTSGFYTYKHVAGEAVRHSGVITSVVLINDESNKRQLDLVADQSRTQL